MTLEDLMHGEIIDKVWGREHVLVRTGAYTGKILEFNPLSRGSLHYHPRKMETMILLEGDAKLEVTDGRLVHLEVGVPYTILPMEQHRIWADVHGARILEISTYDDASDVVRLEPSRA